MGRSKRQRRLHRQSNNEPPPPATPPAPRPQQPESMTDAEALFCLEYVGGLDRAAAYMRSHQLRLGDGKKPDTITMTQAVARSNELMDRHIIRDEIDNQRRAHGRRLNMTQGKLLRELTALATSDITDLYEHNDTEPPSPVPFHLLPPYARKSIKKLKPVLREAEDGSTTYTIEYELHDKNVALKMLAQRLGILGKKPEAKGFLEQLDELDPRLGQQVREALAANLLPRGTGGTDEPEAG